MTRQSVNYLIRAAAQRAGLGALHPHLLRHSCGFFLANQGYDLRLIQDYLGAPRPQTHGSLHAGRRRQVRGDVGEVRQAVIGNLALSDSYVVTGPQRANGEPSVGEGMISSESPMREIRPLGWMSGDWKRAMAGSEAPALRKPPATATPYRLPPPRQSSTLHKPCDEARIRAPPELEACGLQDRAVEAQHHPVGRAAAGRRRNRTGVAALRYRFGAGAVRPWCCFEAIDRSERGGTMAEA